VAIARQAHANGKYIISYGGFEFYTPTRFYTWTYDYRNVVNFALSLNCAKTTKPKYLYSMM